MPRFFHGTRSEVSTLRASTGGEFGPGVYLTTNVDTAWFYANRVARGPLAPHVLVVDAVVRNPYRVAKTDWIRKTQNRTPSAVQRALMKKGHDAIVGVAIKGYEEQVILFDAAAARVVGRLAERGAASGRAAATRRGVAGRVSGTQDDCVIVAVGDDGDEDSLDSLGLDLWDATGAAEAVFKREGIGLSRDEDIRFAAVCKKKVVGGATLGRRREDGENLYTFSVAVDRTWHRKGLGKRLVEHAIAAAQDEARELDEPSRFRVWVVNPHMAVLLGSMGFDSESRGWSLDTPHLERGMTVRGRTQGRSRARR